MVTSPALKKKILDILPELPALKKIVMVHRGKEKKTSGDISYEELMAEAPDTFDIVKTHKEDYAIMH